MRTTIGFFTFFFLAGTTVSAQVYLAPRFAHYFPVSKEWVGMQASQANSTGHYHYHGYYAALGSGNSYGGAIGFQSKKWWNVEIVAALQQANCESQIIVDTSNGYKFRAIDEIQARMRQVKVGAAIGLVLNKSKWSFEAKTSFFVGLDPQMHLNQVVETYSNGNTSSTTEWTGLQFEGTAPGVSQQFLVGWNFTSYLRTSIGLELVGQQWKPKRGKTTTLTYNGVDQTGNLTFQQLNQEYVQSYSTPDPNAGPTTPNKVLQPMYSMNSIGASLSVVFTWPTFRKE